jgi:hypothetical protein
MHLLIAITSGELLTIALGIVAVAIVLMLLLRWPAPIGARRTQEDDTRAESGPSSPEASDSAEDTHLINRVQAVAVLIDTPGMFRDKAKQVAQEVGPAAISDLVALLHSPPEAPRGFGGKERGLGGWLAAWQFAVFEILFHFREASLPVLRRIAFGNYDWTQGNAIEALCRLAAEGVERDRIVEEVKAQFPSLRYEAQLYAVRPLLAIARDDPAVAEIVEEWMAVEAFQDIVEELTEHHDEDRDSLSDETLHATVTSVQVLDEQRWNLHVLGAIYVQGVKNFFFADSGGRARINITEATKVQALVEGRLHPIPFAEITPQTKIAIGFFSGTEHGDPVLLTSGIVKDFTKLSCG